jgi:hypothetical protein
MCGQNQPSAILPVIQTNIGTYRVTFALTDSHYATTKLQFNTSSSFPFVVTSLKSLTCELVDQDICNGVL